MSEVIDIRTKEILSKDDDDQEFYSFKYFANTTINKGVEMKRFPLKLSNIGVESIEVRLMDQSIVIPRKEAAEFFNAVKLFLDSKDKFMPKCDMLTIRYEEDL